MLSPAPRHCHTVRRSLQLSVPVSEAALVWVLSASLAVSASAAVRVVLVAVSAVQPQPLGRRSCPHSATSRSSSRVCSLEATRVAARPLRQVELVVLAVLAVLAVAAALLLLCGVAALVPHPLETAPLFRRQPRARRHHQRVPTRRRRRDESHDHPS